MTYCILNLQAGLRVWVQHPNKEVCSVIWPCRQLPNGVDDRVVHRFSSAPRQPQRFQLQCSAALVTKQVSLHSSLFTHSEVVSLVTSANVPAKNLHNNAHDCDNYSPHGLPSPPVKSELLRLAATVCIQQGFSLRPGP